MFYCEGDLETLRAQLKLLSRDRDKNRAVVLSGYFWQIAASCSHATTIYPTMWVKQLGLTIYPAMWLKQFGLAHHKIT